MEPLAADVRHLYLPSGLRSVGLAGPLLGIAVGAPTPDPGHQLPKLLVGGAGAERAAQVVPGAGEQAGEQLAVGGQPRAGAAAAERLGDGGDDADLAAAVDVAVAGGDLAGVSRLARFQGPLLAH